MLRVRVHIEQTNKTGTQVGTGHHDQLGDYLIEIDETNSPIIKFKSGESWKLPMKQLVEKVVNRIANYKSQPPETDDDECPSRGNYWDRY